MSDIACFSVARRKVHLSIRELHDKLWNPLARSVQGNRQQLDLVNLAQTLTTALQAASLAMIDCSLAARVHGHRTLAAVAASLEMCVKLLEADASALRVCVMKLGEVIDPSSDEQGCDNWPGTAVVVLDF